MLAWDSMMVAAAWDSGPVAYPIEVAAFLDAITAQNIGVGA